MKLKLSLLMIAWVAIDASNMRGTEDASVDQATRELYFRRRYPRRRKDELTVFLVEDDNTKRTTRCTSDLVDELYDCVDVEITDTDEDADWGDYVYYIDKDTNCDDALDEIEDDIGCTSGYRRYRYDGRFRRYRYDKTRWWNRHRDGDDKKKSKKDDDHEDEKNDHTHRNRWWNRNRDDDHDDNGDNHNRNRWWNRNRDDDHDDNGDNHNRNRWWNRNHDDDGDDDGKKDKTDDDGGDSDRGYHQHDENDGESNRPGRYGNSTRRGSQ